MRQTLLFLNMRFAMYCCCLFMSVHGLPNASNLRQLMQNFQENQEMIENLGTQYEIVYPIQYRQDWVRGLSTREISTHDEIIHLQKTSVVIETLTHKLHLDLELNINLLAPTLLQILKFSKSQQIINKKIENCYYHATVRNYTGAFAALRTCFGLSGVIYFENEVFLIHPLYGDSSINHPHVLYHYINADQEFSCGNDEDDETLHCLQEQLRETEEPKEEPMGNHYIELALFLDKTFFEKHGSSGKDAIAEAVQIVNGADLLFRSMNISLSVVYLEVWAEDQINTTSEVTKRLDGFQKYIANKLTRLSVDAAHLLTGSGFKDKRTGLAVTDSICTVNAVAVTKVDNIFKSHLTSLSVTHMIGHNLGMYHDHTCCTCASKRECLMEKTIVSLHMFVFSTCSVEDYFRTMRKGYGECLFNMPKMRESICGNGVLEKGEECDCGSSEACLRYGSCCDPMTCKYIKHAECSTGPCCRKCKLLSTDHMCRPSRGECDIPEFCDGYRGECPQDLYKKNGVICNDGLSYCYLGRCPSVRQQCENLWGFGADTANVVCYERLNIHGTPNGNCGPDGRGGLAKCLVENSLCGTLQCQQGKKSPVSAQKPVEFVVNKINVNGKVHECKSIPSMSMNKNENYGLLEEGTKCGYQKFCLNMSCTKVRDVVSGSCPIGGTEHLVCSGNGICTNINVCFCDGGWTGDDCSISEREIETDGTLSEIVNYPVFAIGDSVINEGNAKQDFRETLLITIVVICILIGLAFVAALFFIFFRSKNVENGKSID